MAGRMPKIVVLGRCYVDMEIKCEAIPQAGEFVEGSGFSCAATGPGPNRAVAASLCDCESYLVGKVGDDVLGQMVRQYLYKNNVNADLLFTAHAMSTGVSVTMVDVNGENSGCVSAGANRALSKDELECAEVEQLIGSADVCLLHSGLGIDVVKSAIRTASVYKTKVILEAEMPMHDASDIDSLGWPMEYFTVDAMIPVIGCVKSVASPESSVGVGHKLKMIGSELVARGVRCAVLNMGSRGCFLVNREGTIQVSPLEGEIITDHSNCSDAFAGALAASCGAGDDPVQAVKFAVAAASIAAGKIGEQDVFAAKQEIIQLLQNQPD